MNLLTVQDFVETEEVKAIEVGETVPLSGSEGKWYLASISITKKGNNDYKSNGRFILSVDPLIIDC